MSQNKKQTDSTEAILVLQGVSWIVRKAIAISTITLYIKHYKDDKGVERIDVDQKLTGGISGTSEQRILDWSWRGNKDHIFGAVQSRSKRVNVDEIEEDFLKKNWIEATIERGLIYTEAKNDTEPKWTAVQVCDMLFLRIHFSS